MKKRYEWRRLSDDGLLKNPEGCGPYYDRDESLTNGSWGTEAEAIDAYEDFANTYKLAAPNELVLLCLYAPQRDA